MSGLPAHTAQPYTLAAKEVVLGWLQEFFSNHSVFTYRTNDERDTGIKIHDKHAFNLATVGDRPAIVLDRKQFRWMNSSIDKNFGHFGLTASQLHMDMVVGAVILHCMSKEGLVAEELAHTVLFSLESFRSELRKRGIWDVQTLSVGEESILVSKAGTEIVSVPVAIQVFIEGKWLRRRASTQLAADVDVQRQIPD